MRQLWLGFVLLTIVIDISQVDAANVACIDSEYCRDVFRIQQSNCVDGFCENPFRSGCLHGLKQQQQQQQQQQKLPGHSNYQRMRLCNSEDPSDASEREGICREKSSSGLEYPEIRIFSQNWESAILGSWIAQIVLSELLDVPVTIETGDADVSASFYDRRSRFQFGSSQNHFEGFQRASDLDGDCRMANTKGNDGNDNDSNNLPYESCGHAMLEVWGQFDAMNKLLDEGVIRPPSSVGVIGEDRWFLPKMTAEQDPSLMSYHGLKGFENRKKLADRFHRPTTWAEYCREVSKTNCTTSANDDGSTTTTIIAAGAAQRPPISEEEERKYFAEGLYIGHFRPTHENDCTASPTTCTGHFLDYPCDFSAAGYFTQQTQALKIGLKSNGSGEGGGYSIPDMIDVWKAANATNSDIIGMWWRPEALYQQFQGTDFELQPINLPNPSSECIATIKRIGCSSGTATTTTTATDDTTTTANGLGSQPPQSLDTEIACDIPPEALLKVLSTELSNMQEAEVVALRSPALDVLNRFALSAHEVEQIFDYWLVHPNTVDDTYGYEPRDAVCRWVGENIEELERRLIPPTFPRKHVKRKSSVFQIVALVLGAIAVGTTILFAILTYRYRTNLVFVYAQVQFVFLLLFGLLLVSLSAITTALPPTNGSCIASVWLTNIGYTFEIVPLIVKIAAINKLMQAAKKFRRIQLSKQYLYGWVALLAGIVILYMIVWTTRDRPKKEGDFMLLVVEETLTVGRSNIVNYALTCRSRSSVWVIISIIGQAVLLLCGSLLSFTTRKIQNDINETSTVAFLIYSNFVFVLLRAIIVSLENEINATVCDLSLSLILSVDVLAAIAIYFSPKFLMVNDLRRPSFLMSRMSTITNRGSLGARGSLEQQQQMITETMGRNTPTDVSDSRRSSVGGEQSSTSQKSPLESGSSDTYKSSSISSWGKVIRSMESDTNRLSSISEELGSTTIDDGIDPHDRDETNNNCNDDVIVESQSVSVGAMMDIDQHNDGH